MPEFSRRFESFKQELVRFFLVSSVGLRLGSGSQRFNHRAWILCTLSILSINASSNLRADQADPLQLSPPIVGFEYRLGISVEKTAKGLRVTGIDANSPVLRMHNASGNSAMEVGDVITHVNSAVVKSIAEIHKKLDDSEGLVQLSVVNVRNGDSQDWQVHPFKVTVSADRSSAVIAPHNRPMLFAYLIADTNDPRIGKGVGISLAQMKQQLSSRITSNQLHLTVISGDECTASNVIKELALIPSSNLDSIFVYYMGHGAFDPRYGNEDTSNGHFIDLKKKDVLRRTIWQYLHAAPAKLRVVVSDACNVEGEADPFKYRLEQRTRMMTVKGATGLEWLLLGHRGELDLSAAAPNQFAWYSNVSGGFFSQQWIRLGKTNESKWQPFLNSLSTAANAYYQGERTKILATPGDISSTTLNQLRDQVSMDPTTFRISLQRDINSPVDPELTRTMSDSQIVRRLIQP